MIRALPAIAAATLASSPAPAQHHAMPDMAGPQAPTHDHAAPAADPQAAHARHAPAPPESKAQPQSQPHSPPHTAPAAHGAGAAQPSLGTDLAAGDAAPPAVPTDRWAERFFPAEDMAHGHRAMMREGGGQTYGQLLLNLAEVQVRDDRDGYRWSGEAFLGGDVDRLWLKSEGEGSFGRRIDHVEVQALYARAVDPYFNLQAGVRHDVARGPDRSYATVGVEGLAPYQFHVGAALFLSDKGDLLGRLEGWSDQRLTQRLILQPRAELNLAAQDVSATGTAAGLSDAELGLRLRYELRREFAPYLGVSWQRKFGASARFARRSGEDVADTAMVAGIRFWF